MWIIYLFAMNYFHDGGKREGPTEIRTRVVGFKVQSDSHYTIGPSLLVCTIILSLNPAILSRDDGCVVHPLKVYVMPLLKIMKFV